MKESLIACLLTFLLASSGYGQIAATRGTDPNGTGKVEFTERITDQKLRGLQAVNKPTIAISPTAVPCRNDDIVEKSDFIAFDGFSTLTPKGAILSVPGNLRQNIVSGPSRKLLLWNQFLTMNRARLIPFEVTLEEAAGHKTIDPKRLDQAVKSGMIVVAVIHGNPTSVNRSAPGALASAAAEVKSPH